MTKEYNRLSLQEKMEFLIEELIEKGIFLNEAIKEFEKLYIEKVLKRYIKNKTKAAQFLGIPRTTLQGKIKSLNIHL